MRSFAAFDDPQIEPDCAQGHLEPAPERWNFDWMKPLIDFAELFLCKDAKRHCDTAAYGETAV